MDSIDKPGKYRRLAGGVLRLLMGLAAILLLLIGLMPLNVGVFNIGVLAAILAGTLILAGCLFTGTFRRMMRFLWRRKGLKAVTLILLIVICLLLILFIAVSIGMLHAAARPAPENATVIVLGAGLRGDRPTLMLADRLRAAARYLEKNPQSRCIVSGGQGQDEICTEAEAMATYLIELGVDPSRIYQERESTSTYENILFSKAIIEKQGLSDTVVIATQEFHQLRAQTFAKRAGLRGAGPCTCRSPLYLVGCYWIREFAAICHMTVFGS